jgi:regulation of enolase protein 1 (concanavalin A-like superfamily)
MHQRLKIENRCGGRFFVSRFQIKLRRQYIGLTLFFILLNSVFAERLTIGGIPDSLDWQNAPEASHLDKGTELTIRSGKGTDWFVDPFDGTIHNTAPILLFMPADDYVFSAKVKVAFSTKWDAAAFMVWVDDHNWAKLSFELSPDKDPTMVTVVTRGVSDDCNSIPISGNAVYLQIAKSGPSYVFYSSNDGKNWQVLRVFNLATDRRARVGFESQSPAGAGTEVVFSEIRYQAKKIKDIYDYKGDGF